MHVVRCMHKIARVHSSIVPSPDQAPNFDSMTIVVVKSLVKFLMNHFGNLIIVLSLATTFVILLILFFLGRMRRSVRGRRFLKNVTKICYLLVPISITYIMGVMHKDPHPHVLSPVWASILIYAYGGVVTITACDLKDNEETLRYVWHMLPLFFWTFWLGFIVSISSVSPSVPALVCTLVLFLVLAMINTTQTLQAFYFASKSKGLPHFVEPIVSHMKTLGEEDVIPDPRTMRGYKYVVCGNPTSKHEKVTTTEEIWYHTTSKEKEDEETSQPMSLGRENKNLAKFENMGRLRDICLSYALFRILLTRFAGFPPIRHTHPIPLRRFLQEGLLSREPQHERDRAFRVIEVELDYLFDFFYTKSHACGPYRFRDMWQHLVEILLLLFFATFGIPLIVYGDLSFQFQDRAHIAEVAVTMAVILFFFFLEFCKYIMVQFSNRKIVWLVCNYIREADSNDKWASTTKWRIVLICTIKHFLIDRCGLVFFYLFKPWQRKLGQYSFLLSYGRNPIFAHKTFSPFGRIVKLPRPGQREDSTVSLSKDVKEAIVSSLVQNHELKLSRGKDTMARYELSTEISDACRRPLESDETDDDAYFILVWHIATSFCESLHPVQKNTDPDRHGHFLAATQLSKYCAYLLTFAPELLPGHPYTTERVFDKAVEQACRDIGGLDLGERYQCLKSKNELVDGEINIVVKGAHLADKLTIQVIQNPDRGWKVLAELWAEVLLYLAPSDDVEVHGEYLSRGGEFITHLWALLTHAGIFTRESSSSTS